MVQRGQSRATRFLCSIRTLARDLSCHYIPPMEEKADIRDTIPRLQQFVPHLYDQLVGLREGGTFEQARLRYSTTVDRLAVQGLGRRTASRVGDTDRYWAPTCEVLDEAMRLGFVERQQLPSARKYLDAHRNRHYRLTPIGLQAANQAVEDRAAFCDELAHAVYRAHPYFQRLIDVLKARPLACPEITEGDIEESRRSGKGTEHWTNYAIERLTHDELLTSQKASIRKTFISVVRRRFGSAREKQPTSKEMAEAINHAFAEAAMRLRGLSIGATELKMLKSWGSQLKLLDQSRYVPEFEGQNTIWLAADLSRDGDLRIRRRTLDRYVREVSAAIVDAYRAQARMSTSSLSAPYLPIFGVRAEAAFRCKVTRALVDLVIERITLGTMPELGVQLWLHLGNTRQPASEPVYRRGGSRRYEMTLQPIKPEGGG